MWLLDRPIVCLKIYPAFYFFDVALAEPKMPLDEAVTVQGTNRTRSSVPLRSTYGHYPSKRGAILRSATYNTAQSFGTSAFWYLKPPVCLFLGSPFELEAESKDLERMREENVIISIIISRSHKISVSSFHPAVHPSELCTPLRAS